MAVKGLVVAVVENYSAQSGRRQVFADVCICCTSETATMPQYAPQACTISTRLSYQWMMQENLHRLWINSPATVCASEQLSFATSPPNGVACITRGGWAREATTTPTPSSKGVASKLVERQFLKQFKESLSKLLQKPFWLSHPMSVLTHVTNPRFFGAARLYVMMLCRASAASRTADTRESCPPCQAEAAAARDAATKEFHSMCRFWAPVCQS
jgi:hypothetical protein